MILRNINILLADDDKDDCLFFKEILEELPIKTTLTTVHNGEQLMQWLTKKNGEVFHIIFLDLNMPRKNGFVVLNEIKQHKKGKKVPVIIFSTSYDEWSADILYKSGAFHYICKPTDFSHFRKVILLVLELVSEKNISQPPREEFLLGVK